MQGAVLQASQAQSHASRRSRGNSVWKVDRAMTRKKRRLVLISAALAVLGLGLGLVLVALRDNIVFFYGPSELAQKAPRAGQRLRIGGLVRQGSLVHEGDRTARFAAPHTQT